MTMRRRHVLAGVAGSAGLAVFWWPGLASAQERTRRVGVPYSSHLPAGGRFQAIIRAGLAEEGWVDGKNIAIDFEDCLNDASQLTSMPA
jgi:hypothetical protein